MINTEKKIAKIIVLMNRDDSVDAPADTVIWAKNLYRARAVEPRTTALRKIVAALNIDLSPQNAVFGERSASASKARQMFFRADENGVDLRISKTSKGLAITGQILGPDLGRFAIKLVGGSKTFETETNEAAYFEMSNVPSGVYKLLISGQSSEIIVEALEI